MPKPRPAIRNERDVIRAVESAGGEVRNGRGSHYVWRCNGATGTFYVTHGDCYPKGTRCSIEKQLKLAGIITIIVLVLLLHCML